jgi:hypothetical protein
MDIEGKIVQRLKHFYTRKDIISEIEENTGLKVKRIEKAIGNAGWRDAKQTYWVVKAEKT